MPSKAVLEAQIFCPAFSPASRYLLRDQDEVAYFARHGGAPEARLIEWALQFARSDQSFIDVGAHVGTWAQHFAQKCRRVYAFEPQRTSYDRLCEGIRRANHNVVCHDVAIGARGTVDLHVISVDGGGSTLRRRGELGPDLAIEQVRGAQLDDYIFDDVGLVKIDVEGAEGDVLRGAIKTLALNHYPTLLLEAWIHDWYVEERAALFTQLEVIGYRVQPVMNWPEMLLAEHPAAKDAPRPFAEKVERRRLSPSASASAPTARPLLGLVMIVRNEARRIAEVLASYRPYVDRWTILDTGSIDGTQDLIRRELADVPGALHEEPFVDFATSRNRALELHGQDTVFTIMPNGDVLQGGADLVGFLEAHRRDHAGAYRVRISPGHYYHPLVMRTGTGWRYKWRTHECAVGPAVGPKIPGVVVVRDRGTRSDAEWQQRWTRDLELLHRDRAEDPSDPRPCFYLGQTHECLGQHDQALTFFELRAEMGGYFDEVFEAKFRIGKMKALLDRPWAEVQQAYLEAHAHDPRRAEPLHAIAEHWHDAGQHALTRIFATAAADLPKPATDLFLDEEIYTWRAADLAAISSYYAGRKEEGRRFADQAVRHQPDDERLRANRAFYAQSASELFGTTTRSIDFQPEPGWNASNPSICRGHFGLSCVVRTVNYKISSSGAYVTPAGDGVIRTRNFFLNLDEDLCTTKVVEMVDQAEAPRTSFPIHGFEDARLFWWREKWWATATVCDFTEEGRREIALLQLDEDRTIIRAEPLRGPWSTQAQKNWMPLVDHDRDAAKLIYATRPTTIFDLVDADDRDVALLSWHVADRHAVGCSTDLRNTACAHGRLRGGSQAVRAPDRDGWIFVVHDVAFLGSGRIYLHRFAKLNEQLDLVALSDPFYFERMGIEFCAGLATRGEALVASYAVNDGSARLGIFDWKRVREALRTDFVI